MSDAATPAYPAPSARTPSVGLSLAVVGVAFCGYVLFNYFRIGVELYDWSKTLASFEYRQYLGMSKRWAMQYGHMVFLFVFLVMSKYIFVSDTPPERASAVIAKIVPYTLPVFIFHFPLLYFFAAVIKHDPTDPFEQAALFFAVLAGCVALGKLCFLAKPAFDRLQKSGVAMLESRFPGATAERPPAAVRLSRSFSDFLKVVRMVATLSIFFGHYTFAQFSSLSLPGFDHWRRWSVPFFFMTSGYFAMLALQRRKDGALAVIVNRYTSLWFMVVPMLIVVPIIDVAGFQMDPFLYYLHQKYVVPEMGVAFEPAAYLWTALNSLFYLNEIFLYDLLGYGTELGGMRAFSNDSFWFLCYLMPFTALLAVMLKVAGWRKYLWLAVLAVLFGPPVLMLAPLFFSGCLAYLIHKRT